MKMKTKIVSMLFALCVVMGLTTVPASASSDIIDFNVSCSPVTRNADAAGLPASIDSANVGDTV